MCVCGEMWRNLSCGEMFPHDRLLHMNQLAFFFAKSVLSQFTLLLSRNLFCSDLRAFVWRKVEPKIVRVEKKRQISGMFLLLHKHNGLDIHHLHHDNEDEDDKMHDNGGEA